MWLCGAGLECATTRWSPAVPVRSYAFAFGSHLKEGGGNAFIGDQNFVSGPQSGPSPWEIDGFIDAHQSNLPACGSVKPQAVARAPPASNSQPRPRKRGQAGSVPGMHTSPVFMRRGGRREEGEGVMEEG